MRLSKSLSIGLLLLTGISACTTEKEKATLTESVGELTEIVVIYDQKGSTDAFKREIEEVFGTPINGLPASVSEPQFRIMFTDESFFKGYFKKHHNIFILLHPDNLDALKVTYGEANKSKIEEIMENDDALGFEKTNVWATPQRVFYVTASSAKKLVKKVKGRADELRLIAEENEKETAVARVFDKSISKDVFYQNLMSSKGFGVRKPESYRVAVDNDEFLWLRKDIEDTEFGIFIYTSQFTSRDQFGLDSIIALRTKYTKKYVPGEIENNYMGISPHILPDTAAINFKGHYAVKTTGWWRVVPDEFMAGPFISYSVYDERLRRIIVVEGFFYGPDEKKAKPLRELETIINSLDIK